MASIALRAFAKINLSLRIVDARPDGFHGVQTILQAIDLFDRLTCTTARGRFRIQCDTPDVPTDESNLVWKAAQLLWEAAGRAGAPRDAVITLQKHIPTQAGLGGGSSDAAAALVGLRKLWKLRVNDADLHALGARLGADVPFFFMGGTALGLGRGDEVYPLEQLPRYWVVLAIPSFGVATKDAYAWFDARGHRSDKQIQNKGSLLSMYGSLSNDLEAAVTQRHPMIGQLAQRLRDRGALHAAMSGSGSTVFGVFGSAGAAGRAAAAVKDSGVRVITARFLRRRRA
jgi:4-diphosphocytidyl-2-C-methyl-D-erythritol kinase